MTSKANIKENIPIIPLQKNVIFPFTEVLLNFDNSFFRSLTGDIGKDLLIVFAMQKEEKEQKIGPLQEIGTLAKTYKVFKDDNTVNIFVQGLQRVKVLEISQTEPYLLGKVELLDVSKTKDDETIATQKHLRNEIRRAVNLGKEIDFMRLMNLVSEIEPLEFAYKLAAALELEPDQKQQIIEEEDLKKLLQKLNQFLAHEIKILEIEKVIEKKTQEKMAKSSREVLLRERLEAIENELGRGKENDELTILDQKIKEAKMPEDVMSKAESELHRLKSMPAYNPEHSFIRTYLDWLIELPWSKRNISQVDIKTAKNILDREHFSLDKVKERILEYLAVLRLRGDKEKTGSPSVNILCFAGPPGVGKTSIGKSIAEALNREFVSISLGGMRDEAEIRGHRRTYVGALPGKIIQGLRRARTKNPVLMMDEIDKIGASFMGDPAAALLEVLDPEQNKYFTDNYLEVPFDLSEVFFITTCNVLDTIPPSLRDRLEVIEFRGYFENEKFEIARRFLIPKLIKNTGLETMNIKIYDDALLDLIRKYTAESGVRQLERELGAIFRKIAKKSLEEDKDSFSISTKDLHDYLGPHRFEPTLAQIEPEPGIAPILAWTPVGGEVSYIEVAVIPGKGDLILTGHLGKVMKESGRAAMSYIRSRTKELALSPNFYKQIDIHIHVPRGAVPKDGPSAGVAIVVAIISSLTKKPIKKGIAMTGEITLRGKVLEVGGIKEKITASHRAGLKEIILPKNNQKDIEEIPNNVLSEVKFLFVENMDQVIDVVFKDEK